MKMKKILACMLCLALFTGCGNDDAKNNKTNSSSDNNVTENNTNKQTTNDQTDDWYSRFENGLKGRNIAYSSKNALDASSVGGAEGYRYTTDNGNIDVYRFDDGDDYDRIVKEKKIGEDGRKVEVNDHMIIVSDGLSEDVLDVFRGLK